MSPGGLTASRTAFDFPATATATPHRAAGTAANRIMVLVDHAPEAANAAWRAALVARDRRLPLHVVAVQPLHARLKDAATLVDALAREVRDKLQLQVSSQAVAGTCEHEGVEIARKASLLVMPASGHQAGWPPGSPVLRMLHETGRPVLAVRLPAYASYRRVLTAVKQDLDSRSLIAAAHALSRDPRMKVLHVLDPGHEAATRLVDGTESTAGEWRGREAGRARAVLADLVAAAGAGEGDGRSGTTPLVDFGDAGHGILAHELATSADLLVIGRRPRHPLVDMLRAGIPQRMLRGSGADVLIVPLAPRAASVRWQLPEFAQRPEAGGDHGT